MSAVLTLRLVAIGLIAILSARSMAQWSWQDISPSDLQSFAYGANGGAVCGLVGNRAAVWTPGQAGWTDLNPSGALNSIAESFGGQQQVGIATFEAGGTNHKAALWEGTSTSFVNLNPTGYHHSSASGTDGLQQVGGAYETEFGNPVAALWSGSAASFTNLQTAGATFSWAFGAGGGKQVGHIDRRATIWSGSAGSALDVQPTGFAIGQLSATDGLRQVGNVRISVSDENRAGLWSGSAASFVNLHPDGYHSSAASNLFDVFQVGSTTAVSLGTSRAAVWTGTASSFVDLHALLPGEYSSSFARAGWISDGVVHVVGVANRTGLPSRAILWTAPVPEPSAMTVMVIAIGALVRRRRRP